MSRWAVEFTNGACVEVEAPSEYRARRNALRDSVFRGLEIVSVRPYTEKKKEVVVDKMPKITVKPNPFDKLKKLLD